MSQSARNVICLDEARRLAAAEGTETRASCEEVSPRRDRGTIGDRARPNTLQNQSNLAVPDHRRVPDRCERAETRRGRRSASGVTDAQVKGDAFRDLVANSGPRQLIGHFPKSWSVFKNLRGRTRPKRKTARDELHPELSEFKNFLLELGGPAPDAKASVDRIDPLVFEYGPGNIRWASPKQQANNRTTNVRIDWRGQNKTLAEWSSTADISYETLKKRNQRGCKGAQLFKGAGIKTYRPTQKELTQPLPTGVIANTQTAGKQLPRVAAISSGEWPESINAAEFEEGYKKYEAHRVRYGGAKFSRAEFYTWVVWSRKIKFGQIVGQRHPHIYFRDRVPPEELPSRDEEAARDPIVARFRESCAGLAVSQRALCAELAQKAKKHSHLQSVDEIDRWVAGCVLSLNQLARSKPCFKPGDAYKYLLP